MRFLIRLQRFLYLPFRLDLRALALLRIGVAGLIMLDLLFRLPDIKAHYANDGVLPLADLFIHFWNPWRFSLHTGTGLWQGQLVLFGLAACAAVALGLGWRTRWAAAISWVLLLSLHNRNPFVLQAGDDLLRLVLFWGMFLPWNRFWAYDAANRPKPRSATWTGMASVGYILLVASVYFFSALLKTGPEWTKDYTALYYALSLDQIVLPPGKLIYPYPELLKALTFVTWWAELLLPVILLLPVRGYLPRMIFIAGVALLHMGISMSLFVGLFFLIGWVTLLGFLPPAVMNSVENGFAKIGQAYQKRFQKITLQPVSPLNPLKKPNAYLQGALFTAVLYCLLWNLNNTPQVSIGLPHNAQWAGQLLRLDQNWGMFAPEVFKDDGWFIYEAKTTAGDTIDLNRNGKPLSYKKPGRIVAMFTSDRWRKYSEYYLFVSFSFLRPPHCNWALRNWNNQHKNKVTELHVVYMKEVSLPDYQLSKPRREVLCTCSI